jgi:alpha-glucoside transport system substrate-binding protein
MNHRRWPALALIAIMVAAACTAAPPPTSPTPDAQPTPTPAAATATPAAEPTATPAEEPTEEPGPTEAPAETPEPTEEPAGPVLPSTPSGYAELDQALAGDFTGRAVSLQTQWIGGEGIAFAESVAAFEAATGIDIQIDSVGSGHEPLLRIRVEGGSPPDIAQIAQPAAMANYARADRLVALDFMAGDRFTADYGGTIDMGTVDGTVYGLPYKLDSKSVVWYPINAFEAAGYEVPTTWEELIALSDRIVADGNGSPWCISIEHGAATGWVATDWIEDVLLRTAPREVYTQWVNHEIPFNDPHIKNAFDHVAQIWFTPGYAYGGSDYINGTWVGQTMDPMFEGDLSTPACWMQKQATWYDAFYPDAPGRTSTDVPSKFVTGEDVGLFYFPPIDPQYGNPALGGGDLLMMFADRPEVRAVMQFLATPEGIYQWVRSGGVTSANASTPAEWYTGNYKAEVGGGIIANATSFAFDGSDLMPTEVGSGSFWQGMIDWIAANGTNTDEVLQAIEESWP